jgi:sugar (pentulose or hexulose) kinase
VAQGVVTVDVGTSSMRAILYDAEGRALHVDRRANVPAYLSDGRVEQDARTWQTHLPSILRGCGAAAGRAGLEPVCIAVTAQRSSVIPVDAAGAPLHPALMWQDTRSAELARALQDAEPLVYRKTGLRISPVFSAIKMAWLRGFRPEVWSATRKLVGVQDWVLYLLTGRWVTDHSLASRTNLLDLDALDWDPDLLRLFGVPREKLCDLVAPGSLVGGLSPEMAAETGLAPGLPVVSAGGDQQCAALGLGLFSAGHAVSNTGTGSYQIRHADAPVHDDRMRVSCNVSAVPGAFVVEAAMLTTGAVHPWFRELLAPGGADVALAPGALDEEAARVPPGADGLVLLPHFKGCGSPHWDPEARGAFVNLSLATTRGAMARAILEAIAAELGEGLAVVEELCGPVQDVHASGGLTRSALFNQVQSDVLERTVLRFRGNEATSQGAWIAASVATGLAASHAEAFDRLSAHEPPDRYTPDPATRDAYRRLRLRSRAIYDALAAPAIRALFR